MIVYSVLPPQKNVYTFKLKPKLGELVSQYEVLYDPSQDLIRTDLKPFVASYNASISFFDSTVENDLKMYKAYQVVPPLYSISYLEEIMVFLKKEQPRYARVFQENMNSRGYQLEFLNRKIIKQLRQHQGKVVVTDQPFFRWFAKEYGLTLIEVDSSESLDVLVKQLRSKRPQVVLVDRLSNFKVMMQLKREFDLGWVETDVFSQNYTHMIESLALDLSTSFIKFDAFRKRRSL